jgi:hypothetical protein
MADLRVVDDDIVAPDTGRLELLLSKLLQAVLLGAHPLEEDPAFFRHHCSFLVDSRRGA